MQAEDQRGLSRGFVHEVVRRRIDCQRGVVRGWSGGGAPGLPCGCQGVVRVLSGCCQGGDCMPFKYLLGSLRDLSTEF